MRVRELISQLQGLDPELEVTVPDSGCGCCGGADDSPLVGVIEGEGLVVLVHPWQKRKVEARWS